MMAEEVLKLILTTEQKGDFRQWFVNFFQNEETLKCTIEEFAVFFLNFIRNQTEEYMKNNASSCNTPRKTKSSSTNRFASQSQQLTSETDDDNNNPNKCISRDLFAMGSDSSKSIKLKMHDLMKSPQQLSTNNDDKSPFSMDCNNFTSDLKTPSPQPIAIHRLSAAETNSSYHTPNKNSTSIFTSTPSFKPNISQNNRTGYSNSRHSMSIRSNDSRPLDDSIHLNTSIGLRQSHEKSKDRRNYTGNTSSTLCLGDFLTTSTSKQHSQKIRKSFNSFEQSATQSPDTMVTTTPKSNNHKTKPKKRVVPTRIGTNSDEFNCPAFRSDNNILDVSQEECANSARDLLKSQKDIIRRVFQEERPHQTTSLRAFVQENIPHDIKQSPIKQKKQMPPLNLKEITNKFLLDKFIDIYSTILDLNLITNILTEFSFLVNLINVDVENYYERNPYMMIESMTLMEINAADGDKSLTNAQCFDAQLEAKEMKQPNQQQEQHQSQNVNDVDINVNTVANTILKNINNCVYFGLGVLQLQCSILRLLDITSLKVLLENERLTSLNATIKDDLMKVYSHKMQLERSLRSSHDTSHGGSSSILNMAHNGSIKVFYQQEQDTQINFPSNQEFAAFKKQRDHFYSILETWEQKHLNPMWHFETELGRRVRSMLNLMDHPINMAHMAKLFTSQLILSSNFNEIIQSEIQSDLPNIDPTKLNKLRQRLIAPSDFSTNYQFPSHQTFFKDFIVAAQDHTIFIEQLKIILTNELIDMDDSSYETLNLSTIDENDHEHRHEYIVKPETLSTLSVLSKFLGLIMARPFIYEFGVNATVDNRQIELRNKIRTPIDIKAILQNSMANKKLIVTLPWVVQFISMLDPISLRSEYYRDVFHIFYELYIMTTDYQSNSIISLRPTSVFIIRSCLGWLFDQQNVPNEYYSYRQIRNPITTILPGYQQKVEFIAVDVQVFVPENIASFFRSNNHQFVLNADYKHDSAHKLSGTFEQLTIDRYALIGKMTHNHQNADTIKIDDIDSAMKKFDPLLESVLHAACPFLADFRVSIMPRRSSKVVSRTGRLRHITPKIYQTSSSPTTSTTIQSKISPGPAIKSNKTSTADDSQTKLYDAFLHSQSLSVRRTVEFVQERVYSAVIKDFQVEILLPFKKGIVETIDKMQLNDSQAILHELYRIYANGEQKLLKSWQEFTIPATLERVKNALDALLPHETVDAVKLTCINIAVQRALARINDWRTINLKGIEIFTKDIQDDVEKILKNAQSMQLQMQNTLTIDLMKCPPWKVFDGLQCKLHQLSMFSDEVQIDDIEKLLTDIENCIMQHILPDSMYKTIGTTTVYLLLLLICNRPELVTESIIKQFVEFWKMKQFTLFVQPPSFSTQNDQQSQDDNQIKTTSDASTINAEPLKRFDTTYIFSVILSPVNVFAQQVKPAIHFEKLADLICMLIKNCMMNLDFLNEQCMNLSQIEWNSSVPLDNVAITMQCVMDNCRNIISNQTDVKQCSMSRANDIH